MRERVEKSGEDREGRQSRDSRDRFVGNGFESSGFPGIQCIRDWAGLGLLQDHYRRERNLKKDDAG